jgi:hypothetical protein
MLAAGMAAETEQALVWLKATNPAIPDARLYAFTVKRHAGILMPFNFNGRRWVFSHTQNERDIASGAQTDWLVFTEYGPA